MARRYGHRQVKAQETSSTFMVIMMLLLFFAISQNGSISTYLYVILLCLLILVAGIGIAYWQVQRSKHTKLLALELAKVDQLTGIEFEQYVAEYFHSLGYKVALTPINDYGVDLIIRKGDVKTAVQTKRYNRPVDQKAIREVVAGMAQHRCTTSMVVTNSTFTASARQLAKVNRCTLLDREAFIRLAQNRDRH